MEKNGNEKIARKFQMNAVLLVVAQHSPKLWCIFISFGLTFDWLSNKRNNHIETHEILNVNRVLCQLHIQS